MCIELQSNVIDLFIPCGNQAGKVGENRDQWVVNPKATSKMHLRKYNFIGALFGMSIRSGILMNMNLASLFWKRLTADNLSVKDIEKIDQVFVQNLETYKNYRDHGVTEAQFIEEMELKMQCENSAGEKIDLCENGSKI